MPESLGVLNDLELLPSAIDRAKALPLSMDGSREARLSQQDHREIHGEPWFEEMIEGSELARLRRRRGGKTSADGKSSVEWEIVEFEDDGNRTPGKRKIREEGKGDQTDVMKM